jgi:hypothetical protein
VGDDFLGGAAGDISAQVVDNRRRRLGITSVFLGINPRGLGITLGITGLGNPGDRVEVLDSVPFVP